MLKKCIVPVSALKKDIRLNHLKFETTADLPPLSSVIGQDRAVSSINFALEIEDAGYNVFVSGSYGTGRTTIVTDLLNKAARNKPAPDDWLCVHNFYNPDEPFTISMAAGRAIKFKKQYSRLISSLKIDLGKAFESKNYANRKTAFVDEINSKKQELYQSLESEALKLNIQIKSSSSGFITVPLQDGNPIDLADFQKLPQQKQEEINKNMVYIQKRIQDVARQLIALDRKLNDHIEHLDEEVARYVVQAHFGPLIESYNDSKQIVNYLSEAAEYIIGHIDEFLGLSDSAKEAGNGGPPTRHDKYQINVLIDNSGKKGAPVIHETNPTYNNLLGRIEKKTFQGFIYTDYTMIKSGSLLCANGGYLIIDADQLLKHPFAYEALKRSLRSKTLRIEDASELYGYAATTSLRPHPIPLHVKVILIGQAHVFRILHAYDTEFRKIFKVRADFDVEVRETPNTVKQYVQFICRVVNEEGLLHFDREGVAAVVEFGFRLADHQKKISIRFGELVKIIREASFWAKKKRHKVVGARDVQFALSQIQHRHDLVEEKIQDSIMEKTINVNVSGFKVGEINGLAVYNLGDYAFGKPSRITVNTYIGSRGVMNIEREAKMSGRIHDKGVLVLTGYFSQKFGQTMPLAFSASITFEQSYGLIDGDSASSTELYALLSSLSGVPLNQAIAVTGSVNQKGQVQAIGGVNEKIEGFFKVCRARGLTGQQGVIIPKANVKNLLLTEEVIAAVKEEKFHIYSVDSIEDGIQILTGQKCGLVHKDGSYTRDSIFEKVRLRLIEFARISQNFRKSLSEEPKKESDNNSSD